MQFDPSQRYVLGMEVGFEHRQPEGDDVIKVGMIDLEEHNRWIELGQSCAWAWQSGCMLQWRPGHGREILWNDREGDRFVCHILNVENGRRKTLPFAVFTVHPEGRWALGLDFARVEYMRPGYGYAGVSDRFADELAPQESGMFLQDLDSGKQRLILSLAQIARLPHGDQDLSDAKHYFNVLLFNPEGSRFVFLHRWREDQGRGWPFRTRMLSADLDGSDLRVVHEYGCGHFIWRDSEHLLLQCGGFCLFHDGRGKIGQIGKGVIPDSGGHISFLPGGEWLVGDTYADENRSQRLYLYHLPDERLVELGRFYSPVEYAGETAKACGEPWRCDLHPRVSPDGRLLTIDSPHGGEGRQIYLVDIGSIVG